MIHTFYVAPTYPPAPTTRPDGSPAVYHADLSPVTAAHPAQVGEALIIQAINLGLTNPAVNLGSAFSNAPYNLVTAPVEAVFGGQVALSFNQLGWPGQVNVYRVDFVVPKETGSGMVDLQLRVSGIAGPSVKIPVQ